jgi:hypothetical protein
VDEFFGRATDLASAMCYAAAAVGCLYALLAAWAVRGFVRPAATLAKIYPAVTVLKPLSGTEPNLCTNLARFCGQDYPSPVQIIFGVEDPADPAVEIVRDLITAPTATSSSVAIISKPSPRASTSRTWVW